MNTRQLGFVAQRRRGVPRILGRRERGAHKAISEAEANRPAGTHGILSRLAAKNPIDHLPSTAPELSYTRKEVVLSMKHQTREVPAP